MVAGGSGIAPFLSILRHRASLLQVGPATLLYSARTWESVICREELLAYKTAPAPMRCVFALTQDRAHRIHDFARRSDAAMLASIVDVHALPRETDVCGANGFARTATDLLVNLGIPAGTILTERYGGT